MENKDLTERKGESYIFSYLLIGSLFPIITTLSFGGLSGISSLAFSTFVAFVFFLVLFVYKKRFSEIKNPLVWKWSLMVVLFISVLFFGLYFLGLSKTSSGNASIMSLFEILTSFLFFSVLRKEPFNKNYKVGCLLMLTGAFIILFRNFSDVNIGDFLIILATFFAPIGNLYQQKLKNICSTETMMLIRSFLATPILFGLAFLFGESFNLEEVKFALPFVLLNGLVVFGFSKMLWVEAIHRISVTKALAIRSVTPFFTLVFSFLILKDVPTTWQILALPFFIVGVLLMTNRIFFFKKI